MTLLVEVEATINSTHYTEVNILKGPYDEHNEQDNHDHVYCADIACINCRG